MIALLFAGSLILLLLGLAGLSMPGFEFAGFLMPVLGGFGVWRATFLYRIGR